MNPLLMDAELLTHIWAALSALGLVATAWMAGDALSDPTPSTYDCATDVRGS